MKGEFFSQSFRFGSIKISHSFVALPHRNYMSVTKNLLFIFTKQKCHRETGIISSVTPTQGLRRNLGRREWNKKTFANEFDFWLQDHGCFLWKHENEVEKWFVLPRASPGWCHLRTGAAKWALTSLWEFGASFFCFFLGPLPHLIS